MTDQEEVEVGSSERALCPMQPQHSDVKENSDVGGPAACVGACKAVIARAAPSPPLAPAQRG